jgi:hypothetical protein
MVSAMAQQAPACIAQVDTRNARVGEKREARRITSGVASAQGSHETSVVANSFIQA